MPADLNAGTEHAAPFPALRLAPCSKRLARAYPNRPWQCLYFLPEPQGHWSLRPTLPQVVGSFGFRSGAAEPPLPSNIGASEASANDISSSPVFGSTLCASM